MSLHIDAERRPVIRSISLYFYERLSNNRIAYATNIVFSEVDGSTAPEPNINIDYEQAQELMDSLWNCGIRPTEGTGSAGSLRATENHLKDMQQLTSRLLTMIEKGQ